VRLSEAVKGLAVTGACGADPEVTGVAHDSRRAAPGDLYVAIVGERFDGRRFAPEAVDHGAVAIVGPSAGAAGPAVPPGVPWLVSDDPRSLLGPLASRVYGHPDRELVMAGVTGTNGKTTTAIVIAGLLAAAGLPAGVVGTLGNRFRETVYEGGHTTPEASDLFRILRAMRSAGARAVAMEVSSHALAMGRVAGAAFDVAVFTNLTRDHLDFHRDLEDYFAAKSRLFGQLKATGKAVVNVDDPYGRRLAAELPEALTFGATGAVRVAEAELTTAGTRGRLATPRGAFAFASPLLGRFNLANLLAAAAAAEALGLPHEAVARGLAGQPPVPGRMEPVERGQPFAVFVDYAHTDDGLRAALTSLREMVGPAGKVAVVFGCGGERDPGKRPVMGRVAGELADHVIVTSDNPRGEDPNAILAAIETGLKEGGFHHYQVIADRREAIRAALADAAEAAPGWAVLIAGKGHEREQIIGGQRLAFSDVDEVGRALEERHGSAVGR
jgi:UDP-N-acetylmuramoyl-L-alanyl-D-glutamate--2,6-diaminopimelate ligase